MKFKAKKLDRRYNGSTWFNYIVEPEKYVLKYGISIPKPTWQEKAEAFSKVRQWCWETYGPTVELGMYFDTNSYINDKWAWDTDNHQMRIYLKSDVELAWFQLKWA